MGIVEDILNATKHIKRLCCNRCSYEWNYKGKDSYRADCPNCHTTIVLKPVRKTTKIKKIDYV